MRAWRLVVVMMVSGWAAAAWGVIAIKAPVGKCYASSPHVFVAKVASIDAARLLVDADVTETVKGESAGEKVRIQVVQPEGLLANLKAGDPVVIFVSIIGGGKKATIHLADTWLLADLIPSSGGLAYRTVQSPEVLKMSYPGRTAAMVKLVGQLKLKGEKTDFLDKIDENSFTGGFREVGKLNASGCTAMAAADVNGDGKADLLAVGADGVRLMLRGEQGFADATEAWGLKDAKGSRAVFADVNGDGKVDVLVGTTVYLNDETKFAAGTMVALDEALAVGIAEATGDKWPDVLALTKDGQLTVFAGDGGKTWTASAARALWKADAGPAVAAIFGNFGESAEACAIVLHEKQLMRYAVSPDGTPASDFMRLVGNPQRSFDLKEAGFAGAMLICMDLNGDGHGDVLIHTPTWGMALVGRGFGAFFGTLQPNAKLGEAAVKLSPKTPWAAARRADGVEDLWILGEDGKVWEAGNPGKQ